MDLLTIERLCGSPSLAGNTPSGLKLAPNGDRITYLKGRDSDQSFKDLWEMEVSTGEHRLLIDADLMIVGELSDEEKARRERMRAGEANGIMDYFWSEDSMSIIIPAGDKLYQFLISSGSVNCLSNIGLGDLTDPQLSPKGKWISFIRDQNLFIYGIENKKVFQLTKDGGGAIKNGMAEFVAQEEMDRMTGYWWSKDEKFLAFTRTDESEVDLQTRNEIYADGIRITEQRYPSSGTKNAKIQLGVVDIKSTEGLPDDYEYSPDTAIKWIELDEELDIYIARVKWFPLMKASDGEDINTLSFQWQNRTQKQLLLRTVPISPKMFSAEHLQLPFPNTILEEEYVAGFVNLTNDCDFHVFKNCKALLWLSERSGFKHIYLGTIPLKSDPSKLTQVTFGDWQVDGLNFVDEEHSFIYFSGRKLNVLEKHLYRVQYNTSDTGEISVPQGDIEELTTNIQGWHQVQFSTKKSLFLDYFSSCEQPPRVSLHLIQNEAATDGKQIVVSDLVRHMGWIEENNVTLKQHPLNSYLANLQTTPEFGTVKADDGKDLFYRLLKPVNFDPKKKYPVLIFVYGGPHVQVCMTGSRWSDTNFFLQFLLQQGYLVFSLDNRGSAGRGREFEQVIYRDLSTCEVGDQQRGVEYLRSLPFVDGSRIGMYGHSYGGYMALMCLFRMPVGYLRAAVSGAPVTDWKYYDTHYTERYQGTPQDNPSGYKSSSVFNYVQNYDDTKSNLMVYHGMADDNVLFTNSTALYKMLQDHGKVFEIMDYPGAKHSMSGEKVKFHLYRTIFSFLQRTLKK
jgi:dipeptidyl-peptidase-4